MSCKNVSSGEKDNALNAIKTLEAKAPKNDGVNYSEKISHQKTPKRYSFHIEKDGVICHKGTGAYTYNNKRDTDKLNKFIAKLERLVSVKVTHHV